MLKHHVSPWASRMRRVDDPHTKLRQAAVSVGVCEEDDAEEEDVYQL
jgi:hypothetical protein